MQSGSRPRIAVVQRRKDGGWVLPKGKLKPNEKALSAARREAGEETGHDVSVHEFLGAISYRANGKPKIVKFWRMRCAAGSARKPAPDIKAVEWLPLEAAVGRLTQPLERAFLSQVGWRAIRLARAPARLGNASKSSGGESSNAVANGSAGPKKPQSTTRTMEPAVAAPAPGHLLRRLWQRLSFAPAQDENLRQ